MNYEGKLNIQGRKFKRLESMTRYDKALDTIGRLTTTLKAIRGYCLRQAEAGVRGDWDGLADLVDTALREREGR